MISGENHQPAHKGFGPSTVFGCPLFEGPPTYPASEEHLVRCGRSTEAFYGPTVLLGFRVEGAGGTLLEAPALSDKALQLSQGPGG